MVGGEGIPVVERDLMSGKKCRRREDSVLLLEGMRVTGDRTSRVKDEDDGGGRASCFSSSSTMCAELCGHPGTLCRRTGTLHGFQTWPEDCSMHSMSKLSESDEKKYLFVCNIS